MVPFGFLCFGISLLLWNCEKEEFGENIVLEETASNYHSRIITLDDIYDVKKHLDDLMPQSGINKTSEVEGAIFDEDHVLEVIDTLQNTNYSLRFTYPDTPPGEFYNLVIGRTPEGVLKTPFVLKYICDDNFLEDYIAHDFNMYYFKGMVKMHVYTDFFSVDAFSRTTGSCPPELDAVGDPIACEQHPIDGSNTPGSGGEDGGNYGNPNSNPGNNSGGTGGSSSCSVGVYVTGCGGSNTNNMHTLLSCGGPNINNATIHLVMDCIQINSNNRTTEDCPSCASSNPIGGIGVNEPNISSKIRNIKNALDLSESESEWLHNAATNDEIILIENYININTVDDTLSNEAKEYAEGLVRGNMIEDKIIDDNLEPCSKLILNDLKSLQQNDIAQIIARFDAPSSTYAWEVKNNSLTSGNVAETDRRNNTQVFDYITEIDSNYLNQATEIAIARTILHELLHAYMISHIDDVNAGNTVDIRQFLLLWNYIKINTSPQGSSEIAQHEYMANRFIPHLKSALKEWHVGLQSDQYYEDLAWGSLFDTDTFDHFHPNGSASRNRIINTNNAEDTNSIQNGINPKSSPCN